MKRIFGITELVIGLILLMYLTGCKTENNEIYVVKYSGEWDFHYFSDNSRTIVPLTKCWGESYDYSGNIKAVSSTSQIIVPDSGSGSLTLKVESDGQILNTCGKNAPAHWSISCSGYFEGDSILHYNTYEQSPPNQVNIYRTSLLGIRKARNIKGKAPTAVTLDATNVTSNATLNASVNPNLLFPTYASFQYGTMAGSYIISSVPEIISMAEEKSVSFTPNNLIPGETYYFRIKASNAFGTTYGNEMSFNFPL